jgi:hypothetical protein
MVGVAVSTVWLHDPSGRVIAVLGTYQDITKISSTGEPPGGC